MLVALLVSCFLSYDGSVGSASAYQSVDSVRISPSPNFLTSRKVCRGLAGVLLGVGKNFRLLMQSYHFSCFFSFDLSMKISQRLSIGFS